MRQREEKLRQSGKGKPEGALHGGGCQLMPLTAARMAHLGHFHSQITVCVCVCVYVCACARAHTRREHEHTENRRFVGKQKTLPEVPIHTHLAP